MISRTDTERVTVASPYTLVYKGKSYGPGAELEVPSAVADKWLTKGAIESPEIKRSKARALNEREQKELFERREQVRLLGEQLAEAVRQREEATAGLRDRVEELRVARSEAADLRRRNEQLAAQAEKSAAKKEQRKARS